MMILMISMTNTVNPECQIFDVDDDHDEKRQDGHVSKMINCDHDKNLVYVIIFLDVTETRSISSSPQNLTNMPKLLRWYDL